MFRYAVEYVNKKDIIGHGIRLDHVVNVTDYLGTFENIQLGELEIPVLSCRAISASLFLNSWICFIIGIVLRHQGLLSFILQSGETIPPVF